MAEKTSEQKEVKDMESEGKRHARCAEGVQGDSGGHRRRCELASPANSESQIITPRPINSHVCTSTFSAMYILPRWVYSYNSDLREKDRTQMTDSAMPCLALLYHDGERLMKYSASLIGFTIISS